MTSDICPSLTQEQRDAIYRAAYDAAVDEMGGLCAEKCRIDARLIEIRTRLHRLANYIKSECEKHGEPLPPEVQAHFTSIENPPKKPYRKRATPAELREED